MAKIKLNQQCIDCVLKKYSADYPQDASDDQKLEYTQKVKEIVFGAPQTSSAPELVDKINLVKKQMFGICTDYTEIKRHFNNLIMSAEPMLKQKINLSGNPLLTAIKLSMLGNYIDFGAFKSIDEDKLFSMIDNADSIDIDKQELERLEGDVSKAKSLVFITDNCGEIVFDKLFIQLLKELYPALDITAVVRGAPVLNDATTDDATQVGLDKIVKVIDNGSSIAGTCLDKISHTARRIINGADVIISKGQANFETLSYCQNNIYYIFLCKCQMFADRFGVPLCSGMLVNDLRLK